MTLQTQSGGTIKRIKAVGHETFKGVADWFFIGDVAYEDGGPEVERQIPPFAVCCDSDEDKAELATIVARLSEYLRTAGKWHDQKETRDGRVYSWTPKQPKGQEPL